MSVRVNVHIPKIMRTQIKVGARTYAMCTNCRTLAQYFLFFYFLINSTRFSRLLYDSWYQISLMIFREHSM